jgi:hypothetical protein
LAADNPINNAPFRGNSDGAKVDRAMHVGKDLKLSPKDMIDLRKDVDPLVECNATLSKRLVLLMEARFFFEANRVAWIIEKGVFCVSKNYVTKMYNSLTFDVPFVPDDSIIAQPVFSFIHSANVVGMSFLEYIDV